MGFLAKKVVGVFVRFSERNAGGKTISFWVIAVLTHIEQSTMGAEAKTILETYLLIWI
jgi:hypothetical protein